MILESSNYSLICILATLYNLYERKKGTPLAKWHICCRQQKACIIVVFLSLVVEEKWLRNSQASISSLQTLLQTFILLYWPRHIIDFCLAVFCTTSIHGNKLRNFGKQFWLDDDKCRVHHSSSNYIVYHTMLL